MRVTILSSHFPPAYLAGGPVQTLGAMVESAPNDVQVDVVTSNRDHGVRYPLQVPSNTWVRWGRANVLYTSRSPLAVVRGLSAAASKEPQHIYVNSLFDLRFSILPQLLNQAGFFHNAQVTIAPRGELNKGALAIKSAKKRAFLSTYRKLGLAEKVTWHASTDLEAQDIQREFGCDARIIVRQNDTALPLEALQRPPRQTHICKLVFASRLSEKKRLHLLLESLKYVEGEYVLRVVGAFDNGRYEHKCQRIAGDLGERVQFSGPMPRERVLAEFADADLFVFPTAGENFGHIVAEALSVSCPVLASDHTPWSELLQSGGGAVIGDDPRNIAESIASYLSLGPDGWERQSMAAGRAYGRWRREQTQPHLFETLGRGWRCFSSPDK